VEVQQLNKGEAGSTAAKYGSQQWVGGSKADKYRTLVEVEQLNTGSRHLVGGN
jgi:hypothetical protein